MLSGKGANPAMHGVIHAQQLWGCGRREEAQRLCESLAEPEQTGEQQDWQRCEALSLLAEMYQASGQGARALESLERLSGLQPEQASVWRRLGNAQLAAGQAQQALESYQRAIQIEPGNVRGYNNLGQALMRLGRRAEAIASYERALQQDAGYAPGYNNLGLAQYEQGQYEQALQSYQRALELDAGLVQAHCNSGNALLRLGRREQALASYERGLGLQADHLGLLCNAANVLLELKRPQQALQYAQRAVACHAHSAEAYNNRAGALRQLHRYPEALADCERALALKADYAEALSNLGSVWLSLNRPLEALGCCDRAMALRPQLPEAHYNRAGALLALRRAAEAAQEYERLLELAPDYKDALGALINARALCCDWRQHQQLLGQLHQRVLEGKPVTRPFAFLACSDSAPEQRICASGFVVDETVAQSELAGRWPYRNRRIRIAYLSDDLHDHPVAYLMAGVLECHDRERFESIAVSFRAAGTSEFARRVASAFDRFVDVSQCDDRRVAQWMHELQIDIAVDLMGHTQGKRGSILAHRAAPVQVNYLGYPGTMGAGYIDYILADEFVIPPQLRQHYAEQVAYLPECFQANDDWRAIGEVPTRSQAGLPEGAVVLCCFNSTYKINPQMFDVWCRLLREVPDSVLWLLAESDQGADNLRGEAAVRGVDATRLIMAPRLPYAQHLGRLGLADLFLDTLPFNAGASASDALWGGVPVLTCAGEAFAARMAGSLLRALGLDELITHSLADYEQLGLALAGDRGRLRQLKAKLAAHRLGYPLFDTRRFCRHLEAAYTHMWERAERGQPPASFAVQALPATHCDQRARDGVEHGSLKNVTER